MIEQLKSEHEKEMQRLRGELEQRRQECERQAMMIKQLQEDADLRPAEKPRTMSLPSPHGSPYVCHYMYVCYSVYLVTCTALEVLPTSPYAADAQEHWEQLP